MNIAVKVPDEAYVPEIEQEVLGTLLIGGDFRKVMGFLKEEHFIADVHRLLFRAICAAHEQYSATIMPIVARLLPSDASTLFVQKTDQMPMEYMTSLTSQVVTGNAGLERSGKAVIAQWGRLKVAEAGRVMQEVAFDATSDAKAIIQGVTADLDTISAELRGGPRQKTLHTLDTATDEAIADVREAMARGNGLTGHTWGLTDINAATGGIHPGEMVVLGARPSMGKTAVALSIALRSAGSGVRAGGSCQGPP